MVSGELKVHRVAYRHVRLDIIFFCLLLNRPTVLVELDLPNFSVKSQEESVVADTSTKKEALASTVHKETLT